MTLFESVAEPASPATRLHAAHAFVERCVAYAEAELERRRSQGRDVEEWETYLRFSLHTLRELEDGTLDGWFETPPKPAATSGT